MSYHIKSVNYFGMPCYFNGKIRDGMDLYWSFGNLVEAKEYTSLTVAIRVKRRIEIRLREQLERERTAYQWVYVDSIHCLANNLIVERVEK